jgi:hypothetical protein
MKGTPKKLLKTKERQNRSYAIVFNHNKVGITPRRRGCLPAVPVQTANRQMYREDEKHKK